MGPLTKRILVAVPAMALLLTITFMDWTLPFRIIAAAGLGLALWEYFNLADARRLKTLRVEGFLAFGFMFLPLVLHPWAPWNGSDAFLIGLFLLTLSFLWSKRPLKEMVVSVSVTFFGVAYFGVLGGYFFLIRDLSQGSWLLLWLYTATWAYDTGGYFVGRFWGRHYFAPLASPKKSVEGCAGGFLLVILSLFLLWKVMKILGVPTSFTLLDVLALSVLLSLFGQLGDLVESIIKRSLSAKDSSSLLPGHGGVFDRIDSLLFNAPVLFYYLYCFSLIAPK